MSLKLGTYDIIKSLSPNTKLISLNESLNWFWCDKAAISRNVRHNIGVTKELREHNYVLFWKSTSGTYLVLTSKWTFFTLNVDTNWYFLRTYIPPLFHVVIERPHANNLSQKVLTSAEFVAISEPKGLFASDR